MGVTRQSLADSPASDTGPRGPDGQESPTAAAELRIALIAIDRPGTALAGPHGPE